MVLKFDFCGINNFELRGTLRFSADIETFYGHASFTIRVHEFLGYYARKRCAKDSPRREGASSAPFFMLLPLP